MKFKFKCKDCSHIFSAKLGNITNNKRWCPYCAIPSKKLCNDEKCSHCFSRSFASSPRADCWDISNKTTPRDELKNCNTKFNLKCKTCSHIFSAALNNVNSGRWCPHCKNKTERMFYEKLSERYTLHRQAKFDWCKGKRHYPFDFLIDTLKVLIEIDGPQHFRQVSNWECPIETNIKDRYKAQQAIKNGYRSIRVLQTDIYNNKNNWYELLIAELETPTGQHVFIGNHECHHEAFSGEEIDTPVDTDESETDSGESESDSNESGDG
jgi:very-short-patch-repair endonuclease